MQFSVLKSIKIQIYIFGWYFRLFEREILFDIDGMYQPTA